MKRTASAHWEGDLKTGKGSLTTQSTTLNKTQYSFNTRFENGPGTNPEELLAASHAGCFTMQVGASLGKAGFPATSLDTTATITLTVEGGPAVAGIQLSLKGAVPKISEKQFMEIAKDAEKNSIISRALSVPITSDITFLK